MNKKILIPIIAVVAILAVLFVPIPGDSYDDGGTREYVALTYKIVDWHRLYDVPGGEGGPVYENTVVYFGENKNKSIDELWKMESSKIDIKNTDDPQNTEVDIPEKPEISEYNDVWLDKETAEQPEYSLFGDIIITEIYSNCFFARTAVPMPYQIKLNGVLSDEWCVGDQVVCTYENAYFDRQTQRIEVDFLTVEGGEWEAEAGVYYKPVIYLYPEKETDVDVYLTLDGGLTCTYPAYNDGWHVTASPDGMLTDKDGQTYNYLYWEGETYAKYGFSEGFCVKGEDTAKFLEDALSSLGLNRREANEFIVYWLPLMQENPYNIISFQTDVYTDAAKLEIFPEPDTLIRVFMAYKASDSHVEIPEQVLNAPERNGFTVIEWGGTEVK